MKETKGNKLQSIDIRLPDKGKAESVFRKIIEITGGDEDNLVISLSSWWQGEMRWARNRVNLSSDRRDIVLQVSRRIYGTWGTGLTNQLDDESLAGVVSVAERSAFIRNNREGDLFNPDQPILSVPDTKIWSDNTYSVSSQMRSELAQALAEGAEEEDLLSAGYIEMRGSAISTYSPRSYRENRINHIRSSQSQCSMTVRHPMGLGSGWAGKSSYDWGAINPAKLSQIALDKCVQSLNPVAIEPGRYTVILEPQATADLINPLLGPLNGRQGAEQGDPPFALDRDPVLGIWRTKLGLKIIDERVSITQNPSHPELGIMPSPGLQPIEWIKKGVLTAMAYRRPYSLRDLNDNLALDLRDSYSMSGGETSVSDMIQDTKRGILVSRIWGVSVLDPGSVLLTGITRDGLWLVENGKISKAIKNFRITESPLFVLNQIEQLGVPEMVFNPVTSPYSSGALTPVIVPPIKARDFSFTSLVDAV